MIKHADLHGGSKIFGQTTVEFSISFGPSRTSFRVWHNQWFCSLQLLLGFFGCQGQRGLSLGLGLAPFCLFSLSLRFLYLPGRPSWMCLFDATHIELFKNFSNADCRTLHPTRAVVCRPRQTREDVHILVSTIQWSSDTVATWYFRNLNGSRCPKTRYCHKNMSWYQPSRLPCIPHQQRVLAMEKY